MIYIFCDRPSGGASELKHAIKALGYKARRLYLPLAPSTPGTIINWGSPRWPQPDSVGWPVLNPCDKVRASISKLVTLSVLEAKKVPHVKVSQFKADADRWTKSGFSVLVRRDGLSEGRGISIYTGQELPTQDSFYSRVFQKTHEFRLHVARGHCIDLTQKKRRASLNEGADRLIRSWERGWVFAHSNLDVTVQEDLNNLKGLAVAALEALGLDFGAIDILATLTRESPRRLSKAVVCEVNTRPGLENSDTISAYAKAFTEPGTSALAARKQPLVDNKVVV